MTAYFVPGDERLPRLIEYLLAEQMVDGGWNCQRPHDATHASFNTTILALEGLFEWEQAHPGDGRLAAARQRGVEFLLVHRMFRSHRSGEVIRASFPMLSFPGRWHYDNLRGLEFLALSGAKRDRRAEEAVEIVRKKQRKDGTWPLQHRHAGETFFEMEKAGEPSR